jgi:nitroreductase
MRKSDSKNLDSMFLQRWSPRAFSSEAISDENLNTLFEAARWSPSCFNEQPWHYVYAKSEDDLTRFQSILVDANKTWASHAPVLVIAFSKKQFAHNNNPNRWADFDSGAAWMALTLQANKLGLHCHGMGGFDQDKAYEVTNVDAGKYNAICVIAIGKMTSPESLSLDLQENESPSDRKPVAEFISEGKMS